MKHARRHRARSGFTLVELMVTISIVGLLAALAFPTLARYVARSKTVEAILCLGNITRSARAYFLAEHMGEGGQVLPAQFPASSLVPGGLCRDFAGWRCPGGRNAELSFAADPTWQALNFSVDDWHHFTYRWEAGSGPRQPIYGKAFAESYIHSADATYYSFQARIQQDPEGELRQDPVTEVLGPGPTGSFPASPPKAPF